MEAALFLSGIDTYCGYGCNVSAQTTIHGLTKCFIHCHGIPYKIALYIRTPSTAKEVWQLAHGIHWSCCVPHHPEATGLIE